MQNAQTEHLNFIKMKDLFKPLGMALIVGVLSLSGNNNLKADLDNLIYIPQEDEEPVEELFVPSNKLELSDLKTIGKEEELPNELPGIVR